MIRKSRLPEIKQAQKQSFYFKEIAALVQQIAADEPRLLPLFVTRVEISAKGSLCTVYFSTHTDETAFAEGLEILKLYKPSMRKALANIGHGRYVPDLLFRYDRAKEKERRVAGLLDKIK